MRWPWTRVRSPSEDETSLGRMLVDSGRVTEEELDAAMAFKRENQAYLLGQALVATGAVQQSVVDVMLILQRSKRKDLDRAVDLTLKRQDKVVQAHIDFRAEMSCLKGSK